MERATELADATCPPGSATFEDEIAELRSARAASEVRLRQMLSAMIAFRDGDFSVRLPADWEGTEGRIAEAFNQARAHDDRISREVGTEGKLGGQAEVREVEVSNRALLAEVTERRRAEQQLQELNDNLDRLVTERTHALEQLEAELRENDRRKDAFIATLAHELRNPLAPVRNAAQMLQHREAVGPEAERARDIIVRQVWVMSRLIDDLMDVSRINQGRIELRRELVDLREVVELAVEASRPHISESGHELVLQLPEAPILLDADVIRLSQVFVNLLTNAAKYTDQGGRIELAVEREGGEVRITVTDDGIGIPADDLNKVFLMFSQVEDAMGRSRGGLGIGLTLVKHLIELHGGRVEARSPGPGRGSAFVVSLPLPATVPPASAAEPGGAALPACRPLRILVVDDHLDGAESMSALLSLQGHEVRMAHDGAEALVAAAEFRPDVMLLDIGLPTLDGYEVCRRVREQTWAHRLTVIALTGWGDHDAVRKGEASGFDRHLVKPVDEAVLLSILAGLPPQQLAGT